MCSFDESLSETDPDYHTILCFKMDPKYYYSVLCPLQQTTLKLVE